MILEQKHAPEKVIRQYARDTNNDTVPFQPILNAIKAREGRNWELRKLKERLDSRLNSSMSSTDSNKIHSAQVPDTAKTHLTFAVNQ